MALLRPKPKSTDQGTPEAYLYGTRLSSENLAWVDEKLKEPGWARQFLISAGILDSKGLWNSSYWPENGESSSQ